jgi:uncharacterized repeat protein (TIGR01451 family)
LCACLLAPTLASAHNLITKTTSTPTVSPGGTATYTIRSDAAGTTSDVIGIQIQDTLPTGFTYLSTASITLLNAQSTRPAVVNPVVGTATPIWGTFNNINGTPDGAFQIVFNAAVANTTACGAYTNTAIKVNGNAANTHTDTSATNVAPVTVAGTAPALTVSKVANAPIVVPQGSTASYTLTITNTAPAGSCPATGVTLTDTLPAGFTYASTGTVTLGGGSLQPATTTPAVGATNPVWGTFTIPAGGTVNLSFTATVGAAVAGGTYSNSASATSTAAGATVTPFNGAAGTVDDIIVPSRPVLSKAFSTASVGIGQTTSLVFTIDNTAANAVARSAIAFTDTLRSGLTIANPPVPASSNCGAPTFNAANATQPFTASAISVAAGASCVVTLTVRGTTLGSVINAAADISALAGLTNGVTSQTVAVVQPTVAKTFGAASITDGAVTTLVFTLTNGVGNPAEGGIALGDTLPTGLRLNSASPAVIYSAGCSGPATAAYASATRVLSGLTGITMAGGTASCTVTVAGLTNQTGVTGSCPNAALTNVATSITATNASAAGATDQCLSVTVTPAGVPVSGTVYGDVNHNASLDGGETGTGVTGIFVKLTPSSGGVCSGPAMAAAAVNAATGAYSLAGVVPGSYCLVVDTNNTLADITPGFAAGWIGTQTPGGIIQVVVASISKEQQNFGFYGGSRFSGVVFADAGAGGGSANNGIRDGAEPGLSGVSVRATSGATTLDSGVTAADGSYLLWLPASASGTVVITPSAPSGYLATGGSAGTSGGSYTRPSVSVTPVAGQSSTGVNFGLVPPNRLSPNGAQTAQAGNPVFYAHVFQAGSGGQVTFSLVNSATPAAPAWSQVLYRDSNCNGVLDPAEAVVSAAVTATAGQSICLIVKQFVPTGAVQGAQNTTTLTAAFSYSGAAPVLAASQSVTDVTTIGQAGALVLGKLVTNLSPVTPPPPATSINADPGHTLEYTLNAVNYGTQSLLTLIINDATPAFTTYVSASCPSSLPAGIAACAVSTQPAVGGQGALQWTFAGTLIPGAQLMVSYRVKVDQ